MSPRAREDKIANQPHTDPREAAHAVAEDFLTWWTEQSEQAADPEAARVDVDTAAVRGRALHLYAALDTAGAPACEVDSVRAAVEAPLTIADRHRGNTRLSPVLAAQRFAEAPPVIRRAIVQALRPFDRADELAAAEAEVPAIEHELDEATTALREAVEGGDVTKVMDLRGQVEVGLPVRLERAHLLVLDLRAHRAMQSTHGADEDVATARQAAEVTQAALAVAQAALDEAQATHDDAQGLVNIATGHAEGLRRTAEDLRSQHDRLQRETQRSTERRMRRLAGLPDLPDDPEADEDAHSYAELPPRVIQTLTVEPRSLDISPPPEPATLLANAVMGGAR